MKHLVRQLILKKKKKKKKGLGSYNFFSRKKFSKDKIDICHQSVHLDY